VAAQNPERKAGRVKAQAFAIGSDWLLLLWLLEGAPADARRDRGSYHLQNDTRKKSNKNKMKK
jgi:hypothetical protein